jgi:hypothetical protein
MTTAPPTQLDYAPVAPLRRRKLIRRATLLICLSALITVGWHYYGPVSRQVRLLYLQRQCLNYAPPADRIVSSDDPADLAALSNQPDHRVLVNQNGARPNFPRIVSYAPRCWNDFTCAYFPLLNHLQKAGIVFCHERTSRSGVRRLVIVERGTGWAHYPYNPLNLDVLLVEPASPTGRPTDRTPVYPNIHYTGAIAIETAPLRIYAGQPDPADPARFTIRYQVAGHEHLVEGRLNNDGKDVTLKFLTPPAN